MLVGHINAHVTLRLSFFVLTNCRRNLSLGKSNEVISETASGGDARDTHRPALCNI